MGMTEAGDWVQCGREFSTQEIEEIRETVAWLPGLARGELAATVCEHLDWHTAAGTPKIQACQKLLERLEAAGWVELPSIKRQKVPTGKRAGVRLSERTATVRSVVGPLRDVQPVRLEAVTQAAQVRLWNESDSNGFCGALINQLVTFMLDGGYGLPIGSSKALSDGTVRGIRQ
jgi:hypothetical protein